MSTNLISTDEFRAAAKDGQQPDGTVFRFATADPTQVGDAASRTKRFVFSDATVDHSDDTIDPKGWNLGVFKRNPVALFSHMSWEPPIGRASNVSVLGDQLVGDIEFAAAEIYEFADTIYRLVDGGFLKAVSVGFRPDDWALSRDKNRPNGIDFKKQTLLEISICPVPCNPNALSEARSIGIDTRPLREWAERALDGGDTGAMPRRQVEVLRTQAGDLGRRRTTRSAAPSGHPLLQTIVDVGTSIGATRLAIKDVQATLASPDDPPLDEALLKQGIAHFSAAIMSKNMGLGCLRAAMGQDDEGAEQPPTDASRAARVQEAGALRRDAKAAAAVGTPEHRRQEAAALKRGLAAPTQTRIERINEAHSLQCRLRDESLI